MKKHIFSFWGFALVLFILILVFFALRLPGMLKRERLAKEIMKDYYHLVDRYAESINGINGHWNCPGIYGDEFFEFDKLCESNKCFIIGSGDKHLGGTVMGEWFEYSIEPYFALGSIYPSEAFAMGHERNNISNRIVYYERKFKKDGHKVKVRFCAKVNK